MATTEMRDIPKELRKNKLKKIKYRRKLGKVALLPIAMILCMLSVFAGPVLCNSSASPALASIGNEAIALNGTDGILTDVWLLDSTGTGGGILHYDYTGEFGDSTFMNCSYVDGGMTYPKGLIVNGTDAYVMYGDGDLAIFTDACVHYKTITVPIASWAVADLATVNHTAISEFYILEGNGSVWHYKVTDTVSPTATLVSATSVAEGDDSLECYGLAVHPDAQSYYVDCGYQNNTIYHISTTGVILDIIDGGDLGLSKTTQIATTDGEMFWSWEYLHQNIERWSIDTTPPHITGLSANMTYIGRNGTIELSGSVFDSCNATNYWITSNESGTMLPLTGGTSNTSMYSSGNYYSATADWSNTTYYCGLDVGYRICAEDSSGNTNCSDVSTFYRLPYLYSISGVTVGAPTCINEYDVTWISTSAGDAEATVYGERMRRNSTFIECTWDSGLGTRIENTNISDYCICNGTQSISAGYSIRFYDWLGISAHEPSNLPAALAAMSFGIITVLYSYIRRRR